MHLPLINLGLGNYFIFKKLLYKTLGDPTKENGFAVEENITQSAIEILESGHGNGYENSAGGAEAR